MALENAAELSQVLAQRERLGLVFARHAYGMRAWVDLFSARVPRSPTRRPRPSSPQLVADNARHMLLFRSARAPTASTPTPTTARREGEAIYERIDELGGARRAAGYALGSLDHFTELLAVYRAAADGEDRATIDEVTADVRAHARRAGPARPRATARGGPPRPTSSTASASWSRRRATRMPAEAALPSFADLQRELSPDLAARLALRRRCARARAPARC